MTSADPGPGLVEPRPASDRHPASLVERILYLQWGPVVAGAIAAAARARIIACVISALLLLAILSQPSPGRPAILTQPGAIRKGIIDEPRLHEPGHSIPLRVRPTPGL
jgi:hypothetical protein